MVHASSYLILLAGSALAAQKAAVTNVYCTTKYDQLQRNRVPTYGYTSVKTVTQTNVVVVTPSATTTPAVFTETTTVPSITTVTTTASQITDTFTETSTTFSYTELTAAITSTSTSTVVIPTTTTIGTVYTVPTPAGFVPIQTSGARPQRKREAAVGGLAARAADIKQKRDAEKLARREIPNTQKKIGAKAQAASYPREVDCTSSVTSYYPSAATKTITIQKTTTVVAPTPTSTATETSTLTATSTVLLDHAQSTITNTLTVPVTTVYVPFTSTTTTVTSTATVATPTATTYAQCGTDNQMGVQSRSGGGNDVFVSGPKNAYDCCVACANEPKCQLSAYFSSFGCVLIEGDTCAVRMTLDESANRYIAGNGCVNAVYGSG